MPKITTAVYTKGPQQFDMTGRRLCQPLRESIQGITESRVEKLHRYGLRRMKELGFWEAVRGLDVEIYTMDGDEYVISRIYNVRFKNKKGGYLEICGIHSNKWGTPQLDHGLKCGFE